MAYATYRFDMISAAYRARRPPASGNCPPGPGETSPQFTAQTER